MEDAGARCELLEADLDSVLAELEETRDLFEAANQTIVDQELEIEVVLKEKLELEDRLAALQGSLGDDDERAAATESMLQEMLTLKEELGALEEASAIEIEALNSENQELMSLTADLRVALEEALARSEAAPSAAAPNADSADAPAPRLGAGAAAASLAALQSEVAELRRANERLQHENESLAVQLKGSETSEVAITAEAERLRQEVDRLHGTCKELEAEVASEGQARDEAEDALFTAQRELHSLRQAKAGTGNEAAAQAANDEITLLTEQRDAARAEVRRLKAALESAEALARDQRTQESRLKLAEQDMEDKEEKLGRARTETARARAASRLEAVVASVKAQAKEAEASGQPRQRSVTKLLTPLELAEVKVPIFSSESVTRIQRPIKTFHRAEVYVPSRGGGGAVAGRKGGKGGKGVKRGARPKRAGGKAGRGMRRGPPKKHAKKGGAVKKTSPPKSSAASLDDDEQMSAMELKELRRLRARTRLEMARQIVRAKPAGNSGGGQPAKWAPPAPKKPVLPVPAVMNPTRGWANKQAAAAAKGSEPQVAGASPSAAAVERRSSMRMGSRGSAVEPAPKAAVTPALPMVSVPQTRPRGNSQGEYEEEDDEDEYDLSATRSSAAAPATIAPRSVGTETRTCSKCKRVLAVRYKFCNGCGNKMDSSDPPTTSIVGRGSGVDGGWVRGSASGQDQA